MNKLFGWIMVSAAFAQPAFSDSSKTGCASGTITVSACKPSPKPNDDQEAVEMTKGSRIDICRSYNGDFSLALVSIASDTTLATLPATKKDLSGGVQFTAISGMGDGALKWELYAESYGQKKSSTSGKLTFTGIHDRSTNAVTLSCLRRSN